MPCLPGLLPVMNDVHAGGVRGGIADCRSPETPLSISFERFGNSPSAAHGRIKTHVAASRPMITILGFFIVHYARLVFDSSCANMVPRNPAPLSLKKVHLSKMVSCIAKL